VKALLPARDDLFRLARVGSRVIGCALLGFCRLLEDRADRRSEGRRKTTADFPQITADIFKPMMAESIFRPRRSWGATLGISGAWQPALLESTAQDSYGLMDLSEDARQPQFSRGERFKILGLVNEPGFRPQVSRMTLACGWMSKSNRSRKASTKPFTASLRACLASGFSQIRIQQRSAQEMGRQPLHE